MNNICDLVNNDFSVYANGTKINFDSDKPNKIIINFNDISRCSICNKQVEPKIIKTKIIVNTLLECEILTNHKECLILQKKFKKLQEELLNKNWQLFCKKDRGF